MGYSCYLSDPDGKPAIYGSPEFIAAYEAAKERRQIVKTKKAKGSPKGTIAWLIEHFLRSPDYLNRVDGSRQTLLGEMDWIKEQAGHLPAWRLEVVHVEALMTRKDGPAAANKVKKNLSTLFNFAIRHGWTKFNPARFAKKRKTNPDGFHTWTEAEIAQFKAYYPSGSKARLAIALILSTGAARQDLVRMGWQNIQENRIQYSRGKTHIWASLPVLPELQQELDQLPRGQMLFITHGKGKPYKPETFGNWFKRQCKAAGLEQCSAHGLRKAGATRLADAGATPDEIRAFMAHKTNFEGATYTKKADRARLADSGLSKVLGADPEQKLSNLSKRLDKGGE